MLDAFPRTLGSLLGMRNALKGVGVLAIFINERVDACRERPYLPVAHSVRAHFTVICFDKSYLSFSCLGMLEQALIL